MLCERCQRELDHGIRLTIRGERGIYQPADILFGIAQSKGVTYTLVSGDHAFEYDILRQVVAEHPEFIQVGRDAFVRRDAVVGYIIDGPQRFVVLAGGHRVEATRRGWREARKAIRAIPGVRRIHPSG